MSAVPATPSRAASNGYLAQRWREWAITVAAFVLALLVGAVLMVVADPQVIGNFAYLFTAPHLALGAAWAKVSGAYAALVIGAVGSPQALALTTAKAAPLILSLIHISSWVTPPKLRPSSTPT